MKQNIPTLQSDKEFEVVGKFPLLVVSKQKTMGSEINSTKTEGILVSVQTAYVRERSTPRVEHFVFAYRVEIVNESAYTIQLLRRRWVITDAMGGKRVVEGEGVIGMQPILAPGERHAYTSGTDFPTPIGQMEGHYVMYRKADNVEFHVQIPTFTMVVPHLLN